MEKPSKEEIGKALNWLAEHSHWHHNAFRLALLNLLDDEWPDISTAPRDTAVLLNVYGVVKIGIYKEDSAGCGYWYPDDDRYRWTWDKPTQWYPLPQPPQE